MQISITAAGIGAACALLCLLWACHVWILGAVFDKKIRNLNGHYLRSEGVHLTGAEIQRRFEALEPLPGRRMARSAGAD